jgi:DNA repair protein RadC
MEHLTTKLAEISISYSSKVKASERMRIRCSQDGEKIMRSIWSGMEHHETFIILCLNRANQLLGYHEVSRGGISGTITDIRIIFQVAVKSNASAIILSHNHPSGNLQPSDADKQITTKIVEAGKLFDISVLDHVILSEDSYFSFADENLL